MSHKICLPRRAVRLGPLGFVLLLCASFPWGQAWGDCNTQDINIQCPAHTSSAIYDNPGNPSIADKVALCPAPPPTTTTVDWSFSSNSGKPGGCDFTSTNVTCTDGTNTMVLTAPPPPGLSPAQFSGNVPSGFKIFSATVTDHANPTTNCTMTYSFNTLGTSGGWGDPHITTADGVHYDFQGAGEFTALRGDGLEIQTRQTPVATTSVPGPNAYTGLATCVATYSAVAARIGTHRVSYEPNVSGVPDPSGLQLRVDGVLTQLGPDGIDLGPDGSNNAASTRSTTSPRPTTLPRSTTGGSSATNRIVQSSVAGGGIEIDYANGAQLLVTPAWWPAQQIWYLNITVSGTTATAGLYGTLANNSWLPALPDGTSVGPMPDPTKQKDAMHQRYVELYQNLGDAWRVTKSTTLFDYAPGTSTATFTVSAWPGEPAAPGEPPQSCAIPQRPSATPVDVSIAQQACSAIVDSNMKADCVFDVSATGNTGFAQTYQITQQVAPGATETAVSADKNPSKPGESVTFTATVAPRVSGGGGAPVGTVQFLLDSGKVGTPVALDSSGRAVWSTSSLPGGEHEIVAQYIPAGWNTSFTTSTSAKLSHTVLGANKPFWWWLLVLLIIAIVVGAVYAFRRSSK